MISMNLTTFHVKRYFAALAAVGLVLAGVPSMARAQAIIGTPVIVPSDENTITVQGTGEVQAAPDIARVSLGVVTQNADAALAAQDNAAKTTALVAAVKSLGVAEEDVQTVSYRLTPQYDYSQNKPGENRPPRLIGYEVENSVRVTVRKISDAGKVLDAGAKAGANTAGGITFDLNDDTRAKAQADALTRAVQDARTKADTLARAAGTKVFSLYSVVENGSGMVRPAGDGFALRSAQASAPMTPVQAGELTVSASVTVKYRTRP